MKESTMPGAPLEALFHEFPRQSLSNTEKTNHG